MNRALWRKSIIEARLLLAGCAALLLSFMWIFVWVSSQVKLGSLRSILTELPPWISGQLGVPIEQVATVAGRVSLSYVDPVLLAIGAIWGISRGSDLVSGEINRGTMEMLLAQPVRRIEVLITSAAVTVAGAAILALAAWIGTALGVATVDLEEAVSPLRFIPAAINVFALVFFIAGVATFISACDQYRWRTIGIMGTFYILSLVIQVLARTAPTLEWLKYFTFLAAFEPQVMVSQPDRAIALSLRYNGLLMGLGLAAYSAAAAVFCRRDIPAPL